MTHGQADQPHSGRGAEMDALEPLQGLVQHHLYDRLLDHQLQPSREQLERRWAGELRRAGDVQPLPKLFF